MSEKKVYLAADLGGGSGRILAGEFDGARIELHEVHRFDNEPINLPDGRFWDITCLYQEIVKGLTKAGEIYGDTIVSLGIDTWGVDYGLLDKEGRLLGLPYQYRDNRTDGMIEAVSKRVPLKALYRATGIQLMPINTVFQLYSELIRGSGALDAAEDLLFTPDLLGYWLTGRKTQERSIASTSQLYNPEVGDWNFDLIEQLGLPRRLFKKISDPGEPLGELRPEVASRVGLRGLRVISVAGHDTASAVAAVPSRCRTPAYLSSGTWSLLGLELDHPVINEQSQQDELTNEIGFDGKVRFLRNICGLWLIQQCRREWKAEGQDVPYGRMAALAAEAEPFRSLIDPDAPSLVGGNSVIETIREDCRQSDQPIPESKGEIIRCIYESLALRYAEVWKKLLAYTETPPETLHVVGGGCQDKMLNQITANAIGTTVTADPVEATGLGNIIVQMLSQGEIHSLGEARGIVRNSVLMETFHPVDHDVWSEQSRRFAAIKRTEF